MQDSETAALEAAALMFANHLRELSGKKPVKRLRAGRPCDSKACPVAQTAGALRGRNGWVIGPTVAHGMKDDEWMHGVDVPADVRRFISAFDAGFIPSLVHP